MKRMSLMVDGDMLEKARKALGVATASETINRALSEVLRIETLRDGLDRIDYNMFWPGYVEEYGPNPPLAPEGRKRSRSAAKVVREPRAR